MADCTWELDKRGILRGSCKECHCSLFKPGTNFACATCNHPPAKHENMSSIRHEPSLPLARPSYSSVVYGNSRTKDVSVDWPNCYNCNKPVFYDKSLGFFIYCSPKCRDEHALPEYDQKLRQEIRELCIPQKMESHTVILETSPKESSGFFFLKILERKQIVITGAYTETAIDLLKKGSIRPHDAVIKINEKNIKEVEEIEYIVEPRTRITMIVARDPAFSINLSKFFDRAQFFRKVVFIRHSYDDYELNLKGNRLQIKKDSMAYKSGLRDNECLQCYATTTDTGVQDVYTFDAYSGTRFTQVLRESKSRGLNLILAV